MKPRVYAFAEVSLYPTESPKPIAAALHSLFPEVSQISTEKSRVFAEITGVSALSELRRRLFERRILDTARSRILNSREYLGNAVALSLLLHKQALLAGKVVIIDEPSESPLGPILLRFEVDTPYLDRFLNWLCPRTIDGVPQNEESIETLLGPSEP